MSSIKTNMSPKTKSAKPFIASTIILSVLLIGLAVMIPIYFYVIKKKSGIVFLWNDDRTKLYKSAEDARKACKKINCSLARKEDLQDYKFQNCDPGWVSDPPNGLKGWHRNEAHADCGHEGWNEADPIDLNNPQTFIGAFCKRW